MSGSPFVSAAWQQAPDELQLQQWVVHMAVHKCEDRTRPQEEKGRLGEPVHDEGRGHVN